MKEGIIIIAAAAILITGCGASRNTAKIESLTESVSDSRKEMASLTARVTSLTEMIGVVEKVGVLNVRSDSAIITERMIEEYDTSAPASETGTLPVRARVTEKRAACYGSIVRDSSVQRSISDTSVHRDSLASSNYDVKSKPSATLSGKTDRTERTGMTWLQKTLMILGIASLVYVILHLVARKFLPTAKGIFKVLLKIFK